MTIQTLLDWIDQDLDGTLDPVEARRLHAFLDGNAEWKEYYKSLKRLEAAARSTPLIHPSPGFADRVMERLEGEASVSRSEARAKETRLTPGVARLRLLASAACVAAIVAAVSWAYPGQASSLDQARASFMDVVESAGVGLSLFLEEPLHFLLPLDFTTAGTAWVFVLSALTLGILVNLLFARKYRHA